MVKYQEVLHGSTSELYINGEREELVTKIEIKMTGDFEDSSFCGEYGTFPIYNGYAIEGTISGKKRNSTLENATVEGYRITGYYGIVFGEVITGINFLKDFGAGIRNLVGGRSAGYEEELMAARTQALEELQQRAAALGAHAIVGVDMDYEVLGQGNMLMVTASGTAVTVETV